MIHKNTAYNIATNRRIATEAYCEEIVGYQIHKSAIEGFCTYSFNLPRNLHLPYAIEWLESWGYKVENPVNNFLTISWSESVDNEVV